LVKKFKFCIMLSSRFKNDGKSFIVLNNKQKKFKALFEEKIKTNQYAFEAVDCIICNSSNFELLSEKDRYGLSMSVVICTKCGLVQTTPRMTKNTLNGFYDNEYRKIYEEDEYVTEQFFQTQYNRGKVINNFIKNTLGKTFTKKFVVEIGTGAGGILQFFKDMGNDVYGVDLGSEYIQFGKQKGLNLEIGTIDKLSTIQKKPDLVIYSHVLEHLPNPIKEFQTLKKYLHAESIVYVEVPGIKHLNLSYNQNFLEYLQNAHLYHFTLNTLRRCLKNSGFRLINGNKLVQSLFKIGEDDEPNFNEFDDTIKFLQNLEILQSKSINLLKIKGKIFSVMFKIAVATGTLSVGQSLYSKYTTKDTT